MYSIAPPRVQKSHIAAVVSKALVNAHGRSAYPGLQARATSARARAAEPDKNIRAHKTATAQSRGAAAAKVLRQLDRLEEVDDPRDPWELRLALDPATRGQRRHHGEDTEAEEGSGCQLGCGDQRRFCQSCGRRGSNLDEPDDDQGCCE